ncbi:MAG: sugar ABC transporter substrate-binding protein [Verrucomicrobia bacterium]|nr:sugar ABC transporter substrate-binding protein [Verrucomicrobiota bacterium]
MKRTAWKTLALLLIGTGLTGCHRADPDSDAAGGPRIALVCKTLNSPFFLDMKRGAEAEAKARGANLVVQAPERELDVEKQMQIVENLIQTRVQALCLTPSGSRELVPVITKANRAGIPVIIVDTRLDEATLEAEGARTLTFIGSDNYDGGRLAGQHIARVFAGSEARVALLEGIPGHETADSRLRGFRDAVEGVAHVRIVASQTANAERDQGFNVTQNLLQAQRDLNAIFAGNDLMALGAVEAVAAAGRTERVKIIGFDAIDEARKEIAAGRMEASVAQNPAEMGRLAVRHALEALEGGTLPPFIPVKIELITRVNAGPETAP